MDRLGERAHRQRLRQSRHALEQDVSAGEQADEQPLDHVLLADDALPDLAHDRLHERHVRAGCVATRGCHSGISGSKWLVPYVPAFASYPQVSVPLPS